MRVNRLTRHFFAIGEDSYFMVVPACLHTVFSDNGDFKVVSVCADLHTVSLLNGSWLVG